MVADDPRADQPLTLLMFLLNSFGELPPPASK